MTVRFYSSTALQTTLTSGISPSSSTIDVAATTGFPASTPYTLAVDYGAPNEELVQVNSAGGLSLAVTRAIDGTSASSHNAGAVVRHVSSARDFADSRAHENASTAIHGLAMGDSVVGTNATQTLHNKTLDNATGTLLDVNLLNSTTWETSVLGNTGAPAGAIFNVVTNPTGLKTLFEVSATGATTFNDNASAANTVQVAILTHDFANNRAAFFIGDDANTSQRYAIFNNGAAVSTLDAGGTFAPYTVHDSTAATVYAIAGDGRVIANKGVSVNGGQGTGFVVLNVHGIAGQTADLFRVQDPTAATNYLRVTPAGAVLTNNALTVGSTLAVGTNATITGTMTSSNYVETMPWTALSSVGAFAGGYSAGTIAPRMRKIIDAGTEIWEFEGRIAGPVTMTTLATAFTFNVGNRVAHERGFMQYSTSAGLYAAFTAFTSAGLIQCAIPTAAGTNGTSLSLDGIRITNPLV